MAGRDLGQVLLGGSDTAEGEKEGKLRGKMEIAGEAFTVPAFF